MTLGKIGRDMRSLEDRIMALETGNERTSDGSAFTDEQVDRIKALIDERAEVQAGRVFARLILWSLGSLAALATTLFITYLKLKGV